MEEFLALMQRACHRQPTRFESQVLPPVKRGRDLVVKVPAGDEVTDAIALAALLFLKSRQSGLASILLTDGPESVKKLGRQLRSFSPAHAVALGMDDNIKKELQLLSRPPDIIVGTPERFIDHMRRENLSVDQVERLVIDLPGDYEESGFDKDLLFIHSKLPKSTQTTLFCPQAIDGIPLSSLLKRPLLPVSAPKDSPRLPHLVYRTETEEAKASLLCDIFYAEEVVDAALVCRSRGTADSLVNHLGAQGITAKRLPARATAEELKRSEAELRSGALRAIVSDSLRAITDMTILKRIIFYETPPDVADYAELKALTARMASSPALVTIAAKTEPDIFEGTQEVHYVDTNDSPSNDDIFKGRIRSIVRQIREEADPDELNRLRRIVRKNVPIFLRGYFMAYLLKHSTGKPTAPQDMKTLFVSIGKNRRVFPRDLSRLFSGALDIKASSIGNIKVLDNYSFIDIPETLAQKAISVLDGKDFRGRKITVNHARKKEEE